jgi:hypothetical protein
MSSLDATASHSHASIAAADTFAGTEHSIETEVATGLVKCRL